MILERVQITSLNRGHFISVKSGQIKFLLTQGNGRAQAVYPGDENAGILCPPQSPWEGGTNENTNGLIHQYFPKGTDFNEVSANQIRKVQDRLNGRPRKVLNVRTPFEAFNELVR